MCIHGTINTSMFIPKAQDTIAVAGLSEIPLAILDIVFAVAGATITKSAFLFPSPVREVD